MLAENAVASGNVVVGIGWCIMVLGVKVNKIQKLFLKFYKCDQKPKWWYYTYALNQQTTFMTIAVATFQNPWHLTANYENHKYPCYHIIYVII